MYLKRRKVKELVTYLKEGNQILSSCQKVGINPDTLNRWRKKPQKFSRLWHERCDRIIERAYTFCNNKRIEIIEDAHFRKMAQGLGSPADYIFYLTNKAPDIWKDRRAVINNTNTNITRVTVNPLKDLRDEELDGIITGIATKR